MLKLVAIKYVNFSGKECNIFWFDNKLFTWEVNFFLNFISGMVQSSERINNNIFVTCFVFIDKSEFVFIDSEQE